MIKPKKGNMFSEDLSKNWGNYLKLGAIILAAILWTVTANAKVDSHMQDQRDTIKLLMLICLNTAPTSEAKLNCYTVMEKP
jgi:hypothetical protein